MAVPWIKRLAALGLPRLWRMSLRYFNVSMQPLTSPEYVRQVILSTLTAHETDTFPDVTQAARQAFAGFLQAALSLVLLMVIRETLTLLASWAGQPGLASAVSSSTRNTATSGTSMSSLPPVPRPCYASSWRPLQLAHSYPSCWTTRPTSQLRSTV